MDGGTAGMFLIEGLKSGRDLIGRSCSVRSSTLHVTLLAVLRYHSRLNKSPTTMADLTGARSTMHGCAYVTQTVAKRLRFHRVIHKPSPQTHEKAMLRIPCTRGGFFVQGESPPSS